MTARAGAVLLLVFAAAAVPGYFLQGLFVAASLVWLACIGRPATATLVLAVAVLLRVPFAFTDYISNDMHRYIWEGRVRLAGHNPYVRPPDDPGLSHLRGPQHDDINNPDYTSIYPPVAQYLFVGAAATGIGERGLRVVLLGLDVALIALLLRWFKATGRPPGMAIAYAWAPLAVISPGLGHVDPLMLLFLAGSGWAWESNRPYRAAFLLACAALAKFAAVLLVPWLLFRHWRSVVFVLLPTIVLAYVPYAAPEVFDTLYAFGA
ncbi:MAG: hypothetical protein OER88_14320, partial [Planctomycetota bacterium]|nr:hypothetical protein [Planctomycetota bacterium]